MKTKQLTDTPIHQWTHTGDRVLLVKRLNRDGTSYGGFRWPETGPVKPEKWSREPNCESGGLFGWPWGMGGGGREPDACSVWLVFAAKPENVISLCDKAKAVPGDDGALPEVVHRGTQASAMLYTLPGRLAWIQMRSNGVGLTSGDRSSAATSGYGSSAATSGDGSSAATSGDSSSAATSGYRSSAATSGDRSSAATSGDRSISCACGEYVTVKATGKGSLCVAAGNRISWVPAIWSVLVVRWQDPDDSNSYPTRLLDADALKLAPGEEIKIEKGQIVENWS